MGGRMQPPEDPWRRGPWAENNSFTPEVRLGSPSHIDGILQWLSACKMLTTTQSHLPYKRENADVHSQSLLETHKPFRLRPDLNPDSEVLLSKFHNPVFWTAIGILSASWTEYTRQQLPAGDKRQWQAEWISWAVILTVTQAVLIVQGRRTIDGAGQQTRSDSSSLGVADRNVLAVAAANTVAHALFLYYELHWTLPIVTVTTSFVVFLSTKKENSQLESDPERSPAGVAYRPPTQADSRRSLNVAIATAVPSTILLLTPQAFESNFLSFVSRTVSFLFFQTVIYSGLHSPLFDFPNTQLLKYPTNLLRGLSLSSTMLWAVLLILSGLSITAIDFSTVTLAFARSLEWIAIVSISLNGSPTTATIMSTVGVSIGRSFASSITFGIGQVSTVAVIGIFHAIVSLPPRLPGRKYLVMLLMFPAWNVLLYTRMALTTKPVIHPGVHPIEKLVAEARVNFDNMVSRQSRTLAQAVLEYQRRYKRSPPPHFDVWYDMATRNGAITLIDEFDTLMEPIQPFWGIPPNVLRERVESSFEGRRIHRFDIREHEWHAKSTDTGRYAYVGEEMRTWFQLEHLRILPDMTWAHNFWDEPRVYAPYDAVQEAMAHAFEPVPSIPRTHATRGKEILLKMDQKSEVRFLKLEHRDAWEAMSLACPLDSPARSVMPPSDAADDLSPRPRFITNKTADLDLCAHPDLAKTHGFALAPAAFDMTHTLFPLFSGGVPNMASDIIYPPPYTGQRLSADGPEYDPSGDIEWHAKRPSIYWKGSSTGGWATEYNWRDLHRQRLSLKFTNASYSRAMVTLLREPMPGASESWDSYDAPLSAMASQFDIHIAGELVLCSFPISKNHPESGGCYAEEHGLEIAELGAVEEAWAHKYVLDIDGNGYSGRFLRLLMSNSVPVKMTVFREWINDWIIPWVHYIPAQQDEEFSDLPEIVRFLTSERGDIIGKEVAEMGQKWTKQVITKESLRLWFLRLLMEYGRLVNDDRDNMNFVL